MPDVSGSQALAVKAGTRRARVAVFGGSKNKKVGRRGRSGAQFNKGKGTPFQQAQEALRRQRAAAGRGTQVPQVDADDFGDDDGGDDDDF
jgi:hypothetical protein